MAEVTAKSLIVDLLSATSEQQVPVGGLVRVAEVFGIGESSLRVALSRLCASGTVVPVRRGEYSLAPTAAALQRRVSSWRTVADERVAWDGAWLAAHGALTGRSKAVATERRALELLGFAKVGPALRARPDNLRGGTEAARERLRALGLGPSRVVFRVTELPDTHAWTDRWDPARQASAHDAMRENLQSSARRLERLSLEEAVRESFHLGGEAIRQIVLDPLLPEELADPRPLDALIDAMDTYDRLGRDRWEAFFGDPAVRAPAQGGGLPAETMGVQA